MNKVINTNGYGTTEGWTIQITLPNGKYLYAGVGSINSWLAEERGLECKPVRYFGACISCNINERAHEGLPIQIEDVSVADFVDKIATQEDWSAFLE